MINLDPWSEWKAGKTTGESNDWTKYKEENPVKVTDLFNEGVDPFGTMAGGALAVLISKGIGAAIGSAFADGGLVSSKPKSERQARTVRKTRKKLQETKQALVALVIAIHARELLSQEQVKDPKAIQLIVETLLQNTSEEEQHQWVLDFLDTVDPAADGASIASILVKVVKESLTVKG